MFPRASSRNERFSNRQAALFISLIVLGAAGSGFFGTLTGGMMLGTIAGAVGILLLRTRAGSPSSSASDAPQNDA